ncbi:MAG: hypothetical protein U5Q03_05310 [Bacteroidota bacterium]|nr:hypothetical protein [Bacteroidota bacterium]
MLLIADSGSSKTDWATLDKAGQVKYFETEGFNPYYKESEELHHIVEKELLPMIEADMVEEIFYYGSGCSTDSKKMMVEDTLQQSFGHISVSIEHDLLGAARALLGRQEGIACILGTGSNSCYYDGNEIVENVPSLGYLYGDEGSGTYIGKSLITAYLQNKLPDSLRKGFEEKYNMSLEAILDASYNKGRPNMFLSSFSNFISGHISDEFLKNMVRTSFEDFFSLQLLKYSKHNRVPVSFTGTVAHVFRDILMKVAEKYKIKIDKIERKPIGGLVEFHRE